MRRTGATRSRLEVPAGYHRLIWAESLHEGGHALAAFLFDIDVSHVWLPGPLSSSVASVHYVHVKDYYRSGAAAFVSAAGAGAERARGRTGRQPSPGDRASFAVAMSRAAPLEPFVSAAEMLFRLPDVSPLLTATAEFLYHRHGAVCPGVSLVQGHELRGALTGDLGAAKSRAEDALASVEQTRTGRPPR